jgi:glycine betaine/proline transport system substrate-binding protein
MLSRHRLVLACFAVTALALLAACQQGGGGAGPEEPFEATLARQPWPGITVKTAVANQVLEEIGYRTETTEVPVEVTAQALSEGQVDGYLGNWWPSQKVTFEESIGNDSIEVVGTNLEGTLFRPAVPTFVAEELGVTSFADLDENRGAFGGEILGIEPGTPGNQTIQEAIQQDAYGLGDWELVDSSTAAMLAEVGRRIEDREPVVFLAWKPHWMAVQWDLTFLEDPEGVWPGAGEVRTLARAGLDQEQPNLHRFLSQVRVDTETQSRWILEFDKEGKPEDEVAREWISNNLDVVQGWLEGVQTSDGEPAAEAAEEAFAAGG